MCPSTPSPAQPVADARRIVLLGSTGSIGTQALDVARRNPGRFRVVGLSAGGSDPALLARQALEFEVEVVAVARATAVGDLQLALYAEAARRGYPTGGFRLPRIVAGAHAATEIAGADGPHADVVVNGITGSVGLGPTMAALGAGRTLALANKESLVAGGALVTAAAGPGQIVPVDSEHSALAQCLRAGRASEVRRLVLTASGGPFRGMTRERLRDVSVADALAHPTWRMGPVVTVNSATMVNKGLELIEAHHLFGIPYQSIEVVIHPQSIVHSMAEFHDGSTLAQASPPDMRLPIALGMSWPERIADVAPALDWTASVAWTFEPLDDDAFPAVALARDVGRRGGVLPAVFNAANEVAVEGFLAGHLPFLDVVATVEAVVSDAPTGGEPTGVEDVLAAEEWARARAREVVMARGR